MYNEILLLLTSLLNVIGTVYAVLSILSLTPKEVYKSITLAGVEERNKELIVQKKQARLGIVMIVSAWIMQCVLSFLKIDCVCWFLVCLASMIIVVLIEFIIVTTINRQFENNCDNYESKVK